MRGEYAIASECTDVTGTDKCHQRRLFYRRITEELLLEQLRECAGAFIPVSFFLWF